MTSGDEPEIWIDIDPDFGGGPGFGVSPGTGDGPGSGGTPPPSGTRGPGGSHRGRWIALVAAAFVALVAVIIVQQQTRNRHDDAAPTVSVSPPASTPVPTTRGVSTSSTSAATTETSEPTPEQPATQTVTDSVPLAGATWELIGYGRGGVYRYTPATGELVRTPVPSLGSNGPVTFAATSDAALIRPLDTAPGVGVVDGHAASPLDGMLGTGHVVLPGPKPDLVWTVAPALIAGSNSDGVKVLTAGTHTFETSEAKESAILVAVDSRGMLVGPVIHLPPTAGINPDYAVHPDGAGYVLFDGVGGVYSLRPDGAHLITAGQMLAAGPTGYLVYECDERARCGTVVVDRKTLRRTQRLEFTPSESQVASGAQGVISPDGRYAAMPRYADGPQLTLLNLTTGSATLIGSNTDDGAPIWFGAATNFVFTPDSAALLIAEASGVDVFDPKTGTILGRLPIPAVAALALRPAK